MKGVYYFRMNDSENTTEYQFEWNDSSITHFHIF